MHPVDQYPHLPGIDEERLFAPVPELVVLLVPGHKPEACRNRRGVKELPRQSDHAVYEISLDDVLPDLSLTGLVGGHGTVGEYEARDAGRREVVDEMLDPGEIGVTGGRHAVSPTPVIF